MATGIMRVFYSAVLAASLLMLPTHAAYANNTMPIPAEGVVLPNGVQVLPDGTIIDGNRMITPSNTIIAGNTVYIPQSTPTGGGGGGTLYSDRVVFADGRQYYWDDRRIIMPDGSNILSDGRVLSADGGEPVMPQRGRLGDDGVTLPNGMVVAPSLKSSVDSARQYASTIPREYSTEFAAQMGQVLAPSEMRNYFEDASPRDAAAVMNAMNLNTDQMASYIKDMRLSGDEMGRIVDQMGLSSDAAKSLFSALSAQGYPSFQLESLMSNMPSFLQDMGGDLGSFLSGLGISGGLFGDGGFLGNIFGGGSGGDDGFDGQSAYAGTGTLDTRFESEVFYGDEIPGSKSSVPIPHLTTPLASLLAEYSPYLYVKGIDQNNKPNDYTGEFYRGTQNNPRMRDNMLGFSKTGEECAKDPSAAGCSVGDGRRLNGCVDQLKPPSNYANMSLEEKAAFNRLRMDNCANQYILMANMFPDAVDAPPGQGLVGNTAAEACQPLRIKDGHLKEYNEKHTSGPAGLIKSGKNYLREYIEGAWKKLLVDEEYLIRSGMAPREPHYSYYGSNKIKAPLSIREALDTSGNIRGVAELYSNPRTQVEQIIDPTHPFSPRWDYEMTEREMYSPEAHEGWGADEKNSVYCAGSKKMVDEWDCKSDPYKCVKGQDEVHDMGVHVMAFRKTEYKQHMDIRMRWNKRCKDNKITRDLLDNVGCTWDFQYFKIKWPCWHIFCMGAYGLHPLGKEKPPCAVRLGGKDTPVLWFLRQIAANTIGNMADVGQVMAVGSLMNQAAIQKELTSAAQPFMRNAMANMNIGNFNLNQLMNNGSIQGMMGNLNPSSMLSQFQLDRMFQMPDFQNMVGQLGFGQLQAQFDGVMNKFTDLADVQNLMGMANPQYFMQMADQKVLGALKNQIGLDKFQSLMDSGFSQITSMQDMFANAQDFASFLQNPDVAGMLDSRYSVNDMFTKMSSGAIFNPNDPESMALLGSVVGQSTVAQWQQAGVLEQKLSGTLEDLAGGAQEAQQLLSDAEREMGERRQQKIADNCIDSSGNTDEACASNITSGNFLSNGVTSLGSFMQSSGVQDIISQNPFNQTFNMSQLSGFFSSEGFQTQIAAGMENFGQLIGGADNIMALAGDMDFINQIQGMNVGGFFDGMDNMNILGTELFSKMNNMSLTQMWGNAGWAQNLPNLQNIIDPSALQGMMDNFNANEFLNFKQFQGWMNNGTLQNLVGGEWMNKLQGMGTAQLQNFFKNNPLSKVMGGNFMNSLTSGNLLQKLPFNNVTNKLGKTAMKKMNGMANSADQLEEILDWMGCGVKSIDKICHDLAKPFGMLNKLKIRHFDAEMWAEDPLSVDLPLGVPEGLTFKEYFAVHRPYPAFHDTGKELGQTGKPDLKKSTKGAEVAIVGVGRPGERCLFGGGGGAMTSMMGPFGGGSYVQVPALDPITSWAELKLYQSRGTRRNLNCITQFNKVWKPNFTEDPILFLDGAQVEVMPIEEDDVAEGDTVKYIWPEPYRGYCLDPNNDLTPDDDTDNQKRNFPYFPEGTVAGGSMKTGIDRAKKGDIIIFDRGTTTASGPFGMGSKPGLCTLGYVVGTIEKTDTHPEAVRIVEANWGNYPDVCGITDAMEPHATVIERTLYKGSMQDTRAKRIKEQVGWEPKCDDTNLRECALDSNIWDGAKVYDPTLDKRYPE